MLYVERRLQCCQERPLKMRAGQNFTQSMLGLIRMGNLLPSQPSPLNLVKLGHLKTKKANMKTTRHAYRRLAGSSAIGRFCFPPFSTTEHGLDVAALTRMSMQSGPSKMRRSVTDLRTTSLVRMYGGVLRPSGSSALDRLTASVESLWRNWGS